MLQKESNDYLTTRQNMDPLASSVNGLLGWLWRHSKKARRRGLQNNRTTSLLWESVVGDPALEGGVQTAPSCLSSAGPHQPSWHLLLCSWITEVLTACLCASPLSPLFDVQGCSLVRTTPTSNLLNDPLPNTSQALQGLGSLGPQRA